MKKQQKNTTIIIIIITVVVSIVVFISLFFLVSDRQGSRSRYLPGQEKEFKGSISKGNNEATIRVYVDSEVGDDLDVKLILGSERIVEMKRTTDGKYIAYSSSASPGTDYRVRVKNKTNSTIHSFVNVSDND